MLELIALAVTGVFELIIELLVLGAIAYYFYRDYQKAKREEGQNLKGYMRGILIFIAIIVILNIIF